MDPETLCITTIKSELTCESNLKGIIGLLHFTTDQTMCMLSYGNAVDCGSWYWVLVIFKKYPSIPSIVPKEKALSLPSLPVWLLMQLTPAMEIEGTGLASRQMFFRDWLRFKSTITAAFCHSLSEVIDNADGNSAHLDLGFPVSSLLYHLFSRQRSV